MGKKGTGSHIELGERLIVGPGEPIGGERVGEGERYHAKVNVRESAIAHMASRGRLDPTQIQAGEKFRKLCELASIGRQHSIDFEAQGRSIGKISGDPFTESLVRAGRELNDAVHRLGPVYSAILLQVVGEGRLIADVARGWAGAGGIVSGARAEGYITGTLIDGIDALVEIWRMESDGRPKRESTHYGRGSARHTLGHGLERTEIEVNDSIRASGPMSYTGPVKQINIGELGEIDVVEKRGVDRGALTPHASGNVQEPRPKK